MLHILLTISAASALLAPTHHRQSASRRLPSLQAEKDDGRRAVIGNSRWLSHAPPSFFARDKLTKKGVRANADSGEPRDSGRPLVKVGDVSVGSWQCSEGGWDSPAPRASTETFLVLEGAGSVDDADGTRHRFGAGDTVVLPRGWSGRWDVTEDLRKVWVVNAHDDVAGASKGAVVAATDFAGAKDTGVRADATGGAPACASKQIYGVGSTAVGLWSCTPGSWPVEERATTEAFYVLEGAAFLTNDDGTSTRAIAGDTVVLPKGWTGRWDVLETLSKVWVVVSDGAPVAAGGAARRPIVGGNWKCNPEKVGDLGGLVANINACDASRCDVYVCPSNAHLGAVYDKFVGGARVAAQNCNFGGCGAYTGEMAAEQLVDMGLEWVMLGHSERRGEFDLPTPAESDALLATKARYALDAGLNVVLAIGEPLSVRERGVDAVLAHLVPQMELVKDVLDPARVVLAYEPVWSIGTGVTASPEQAQETHAAIRKWVSENVSPAAAAGIRIQYGGSANAANAAALAAMPDIDGFLVGGASLKPEFADIVAAVSDAKDAPAVAATPGMLQRLKNGVQKIQHVVA